MKRACITRDISNIYLSNIRSSNAVVDAVNTYCTYILPCHRPAQLTTLTASTIWTRRQEEEFLYLSPFAQVRYLKKRCQEYTLSKCQERVLHKSDFTRPEHWLWDIRSYQCSYVALLCKLASEYILHQQSSHWVKFGSNRTKSVQTYVNLVEVRSTV